MKHILIVDDSSTARLCIKTCIKSAGIRDVTFHEANNGKEALSVLMNKKIIPDLIVTDLNMPLMNGELLLKKVKSSPKFTDVPVVIITSTHNASLENRLTECGAFAVLNKPVTAGSFSSVCDHLIPGAEPTWG